MSGKFKCKSCSRWLHYGVEDVVECPSCHKRKVIEENYKQNLQFLERDCAHFPRPRATISRALAYTSAIYRQATHNEPFNIGKVEATLAQHGGVSGSSVATHSSVKSRHARSFGTFGDSRPGLAVIVAEGSSTRGPWTQIHVVFRGSRGDKAYDQKDNPAGAGWHDEDGELQNVDWAANFTTRHVIPAWGADPVRVHEGFHEVYGSMRQPLHDELNTLLGKHPHASVIVSGHSLGAALAVTCTHDLSCTGIARPFCFPFNTPMVGNMHFALNFNDLIASRWTTLAGEDGLYPRMLNFVRRSDPVSWGRHGFKDQSAEAIEKRRKGASDTNIIRKAMRAMVWKSDKKQIFYQTPNLVIMGWLPVWSAHNYTDMQHDVIGKTLFK